MEVTERHFRVMACNAQVIINGVPPAGTEPFSDAIKFLGFLEERERQVIVLRYGLDAETPRTLSDVGKLLGITRERVRQIETRALSKLRHPASAYDLESLL